MLLNINISVILFFIFYSQPEHHAGTDKVSQHIFFILELDCPSVVFISFGGADIVL